MRGGGSGEEGGEDENGMLLFFSWQQNWPFLSDVDTTTISPRFLYFTFQMHNEVSMIIAICLLGWVRFKVNKHETEEEFNASNFEAKLKTIHSPLQLITD